MHQELICDATGSFSLATPHRREPSWQNETFVLICGDYTTLACTRQAIAWWLFIPTAEAGGFQATAPVISLSVYLLLRWYNFYMLTFPGITPIDYLIIGHITQDLTPEGTRIGGTAAYSGLTSHAFGQRVGVVTAWAEETGKEALKDIQIANLPCEASSTFENIYTKEGRQQVLHHVAPNLAYYHIPESWRRTPIVQLAPMTGELPAELIRYFPDAQIYLTPQGWMRQWDREGRVTPRPWLEASYMLPQAHAVAISEEDVGFDLGTIYRMAASVPVLAVTRGEFGADIYFEGKIVNIPAPVTPEVDPTGAGDIFAAAFFTQLAHHRDPIKAAEMAVIVASDSISRTGLPSAPNPDTLYEILRKVQ
jgi:hypothetical protein